MRIRESLPHPYMPWTGNEGPLEGAVAGGWNLGIVEQPKGKGLLLTVERWIEGVSGRRLWSEMSVEES